MNYQTRLLMCRGGFVLFCLLPTIAVGGWIVFRSAPSFPAAQKVEAGGALTSRLELVVQIGRIRYPRPGVARLADVRVLGADTTTVIAEPPELELSATADGWLVRPVTPPSVATRAASAVSPPPEQNAAVPSQPRPADVQPTPGPIREPVLR